MGRHARKIDPTETLPDLFATHEDARPKRKWPSRLWRVVKALRVYLLVTWSFIMIGTVGSILISLHSASICYTPA